MKNCIRIPRVFIPEQNFEKWASPACDLHAGDRSFWENAARVRGEFPSALSCLVPDAYLGDEDEARRKEMRENMYNTLESPVLERLNRGFILVTRETSCGTRTGILAAVDLEEYSPEAEKSFLVRAVKETDPRVVGARYEARKLSVLEFPHTVLLYHEKKSRILHALGKEELERVYEFDYGAGVHVSGDYIPDFIAEEVARDLLSHADCFFVADGDHTLTAAKKFWEELRENLSAIERRNHPARFALAELVDYNEAAVQFEPVPRLVTEIEAEAFCSYFAKNVKCKRSGNTLFSLLTGADGYRRAEETILNFIKSSGGRLQYVPGAKKAPQEEGALVVLPPLDKDDVLSAAKAGKKFPCRSFTLGKEEDARLCFEGREISYD